MRHISVEVQALPWTVNAAKAIGCLLEPRLALCGREREAGCHPRHRVESGRPPLPRTRLVGAHLLRRLAAPPSRRRRGVSPPERFDYEPPIQTLGGWLASARRRWRGRCGGEGKGGLGGTAGCSLARPSERVGSPGAVRFLDVRSPSWQVILHMASNCNSPRAREARVVNAHMTSYKAGSDPCCDAAFGAPNILDSRMYTFTRIENPSLPAAGGPAGPRHALSDKPKCSDTYILGLKYLGACCARRTSFSDCRTARYRHLGS